MRLVTLLALVAVTSASNWPLGTNDVPPDFDCEMRKLAYSFGKQLIPRLGAFESLFYALDLNAPNCTGTLAGEITHKEAYVPSFGNAIFVSPNGNDSSDGTEALPLLSLQKAVDLAAERTDTKTVVLRAGTHFLADTLMLTPAHSSITIMGYPGEQVEVSGGVQLKVTWKPYKVSNTSNIYVADVSGQVTDVPGLQLNGVRATRARYPNLPGGIEVSPGYDAMISSDKGIWTPPDLNRFGPVSFYTDHTPEHTRNDTLDGWFQNYMIGIGGLCSVYDPPVSYWCSERPSGGGAFAFRTPSGVAIRNNALPNLPYKDPLSALFFVWRPARWANWMFEVKSYDAATQNFTFGKGGFQGARGANTGGAFFVENVFEELDYPGEFFFDKASSQLYLFYNGTGSPPADLAVVVPQKQVLVNATGTQWNPIRDLKLTGVKYTAAAYTYMEPHGVPSAGDWALDRFAAVFLQGTEGTIIDGCTFDRLDGNAVMVSGYNRNATIQNSDFSYIGGNAIACWGYTNETSGDNHPHAGVDGTDGNHPRYTTVLSNTAREVGLYEKQSSFFVQAKTAQSIIKGNVFFNGPRAGINVNDGFGGGDELGHNLVFSTCRESGDHGPFNSWDRQPYLTTVRTGEPSMQMAFREIHHNFFIDNYSPQEGVDNDDGSAYYNTHHNFLVYGNRAMKNDFGGHDNYHTFNLYAYVASALGICPAKPDHVDHFTNNTLVMTADNTNAKCGNETDAVLGGNNYYTPTGNITTCGMDLRAAQARGYELGSTVALNPDATTIIGWAKALLSIS